MWGNTNWCCPKCVDSTWEEVLKTWFPHALCMLLLILWLTNTHKDVGCVSHPMLNPVTRPCYWTSLDPNWTHWTLWTSIRTFCSTYLLLTHLLCVILGPHSGLHLSPDICPTLLHHPIYPSTLLTLFMFTRLHLFPCTGLQILSLLTRLKPDLLFGPAPLVYKSALLNARSSVLVSC